MIEYPILETPFSWLVVASLLLAVSSSLCLLALYQRARYLYVKPSLQLLTFNVFFFHWPVAIFSGYLEQYLPDPYAVVIVLGVFFAVGLTWSVLTYRDTSKILWQRIVGSQSGDPSQSNLATGALLILSAAIMILYFRTVPLTQTGLYVALLSPDASTMAREESLKLLDSKVVKYSYSILASTIGPLLGVLLSLAAVAALRARRRIRVVLRVALLLVLLCVLSITGARSFAVTTLLAAVLALWFRRGLEVRPTWVLAALVFTVSPAVLLTLLREGHVIDFASVASYFGLLVGERFFVSPTEVGAAYIHYAQTQGYIGIAAVPKFAQLIYGIEGIDVPNVVGLRYFGGTALSVSANSGFLWSYYGYFGAAGLVIACLGMMILDLVLYAYRAISDVLLLPCISVLCAATVSLVSVDFTVIFITHGFALTPMVCLLLSRERRRDRYLQGAGSTV